MDFSKINIFSLLIDLVQTVGLALLGFLAYARKPGEDAQKENDGLDKRVTAIEQALARMPTQEALHELQLNMTEAKTRLELIYDVINRLSQQTARMETYLLNRKGDAE